MQGCKNYLNLLPGYGCFVSSTVAKWLNCFLCIHLLSIYHLAGTFQVWHTKSIK